MTSIAQGLEYGEAGCLVPGRAYERISYIEDVRDNALHRGTSPVLPRPNEWRVRKA